MNCELNLKPTYLYVSVNLLIYGSPSWLIKYGDGSREV